MGKRIFVAAVATLGLTMTLGACASDSMVGSGATSALPDKPKPDPVCTMLSQKLDGLRREGASERVEQASQGKGTTVSVKRESLAKVAELNKTSLEFQQKCSAYKPAVVAAAIPPPDATPAKAVAKSAKAATAKPKAETAVPAAGNAATVERKE